MPSFPLTLIFRYSSLSTHSHCQLVFAMVVGSKRRSKVWTLRDFLTLNKKSYGRNWFKIFVTLPTPWYERPLNSNLLTHKHIKQVHIIFLFIEVEVAVFLSFSSSSCSSDWKRIKRLGTNLINFISQSLFSHCSIHNLNNYMIWSSLLANNNNNNIDNYSH